MNRVTLGEGTQKIYVLLTDKGREINFSSLEWEQKWQRIIWSHCWEQCVGKNKTLHFSK